MIPIGDIVPWMFQVQYRNRMQTWLHVYIVATVCRISLALIWVLFPPIAIFQYTPTRTRTDLVRNKCSFLISPWMHPMCLTCRLHKPSPPTRFLRRSTTTSTSTLQRRHRMQRHGIYDFHRLVPPYNGRQHSLQSGPVRIRLLSPQLPTYLCMQHRNL